MPKVRVSTTVDAELLRQARSIWTGSTDSSLLEEALRSLITSHREAEVDAAYAAAYSEHRIDEPDAWGDLAAWRANAGAS